MPEALACSRPVVAFDLNAADEVVEHGKTGYLVKPLDIEGLAESIVKILTDTTAAEEMGKEGRRRVEREFSKEHMVENIHRVYQDLLQT